MKKLLIVEDNLDTRKMLFYSISKYFLCEIISATNGKEALEIIDKESPDLILLDICMPVMDGKQFLENLRIYRNDKTIVIALTALTDEYTINKIISLGAAFYLVKPLKLDILIDKIGKFIPLRRTINKNRIAS